MANSIIRTGYLAATLALVAFFGTSLAAESKPESKKEAEVKKGVLKQESLKQMLENLGYTPEVITSTAGHPMNKVRFERDGWTFVVYVSISQSGSYVWLSAPLKDVPSGMPTGDPLKKILAASDAMGPCHFTLKGDRLYLNQALENRDLTPARLRSGLDETTGHIKSTVAIWNVDFKAKPEVASAKVEPVK